METAITPHIPAYDEMRFLSLIPNPDCIFDTGAGFAESEDHPRYAFIYNFECYAGSVIACSWVPIAEMRFSRSMAFAAAIRWDMEFYDEVAV